MIKRIQKCKPLAILWQSFKIASCTVSIMVVLIIGAIAMFPDSILKWFGELWQVTESPPEQTEAYIVLGGGNAYRPQAVAGLWKKNQSATVFVTIAESETHPNQELDTISTLVKEGVDRDSIELIPPAVSSTHGEALLIGMLVRERELKSVVIPTDIFHSRRARWIFRKHLPDECTVSITEAPFRHFLKDSWWKNEHGVLHFQNEIIKTIYYFIRY